MVVNSGVDLAREERLKKCDAIIEQYEKIRISPMVEKVMKKQQNDEVFDFVI
jgi:hypothetical protein